MYGKLNYARARERVGERQEGSGAELVIGIIIAIVMVS